VTGVFQALVVVSLFLLTAVVGVATLVMVRRGHHDNPGQQLRTPPSRLSTLPSSSAQPGTTPRTEIGRPDAGSGEEATSETQLEDLRAKAKTLLASAQTARAEAEEESLARRTELRELRADLERREQRLSDREERLDSDVRALEDRTRQLEELRTELKNQRRMLAELEAQQQSTLERIAGLTAEQAKAELIAAVAHDAKRQAVLMARDIERQAVREADGRAQTIIVGAIQRLASELTSESVVSAVHLPGDDMKGRIIGREGRNIRAFEQVTGVNVMIDDTPEAVLLSCFDPVRRETARMTLTELVADGRIHPARIEEVHERSKSQIQAQCLRAAEDAMTEVGISDLHPALVPVLGTLRYRTSYGQNVLKHLVESAHIAALMAAELGLDVAHCKRAAFLHDIGKALTHEVEGSHALVGADLARKYGEHADVVHAIEAHHGEVEVIPSRQSSFRRPTRSAAAGRAPGAKASRLTCSGWSGSKRSPVPATAWTRCSRCRRAARFGSW
jgi:ribonucrease Y